VVQLDFTDKSRTWRNFLYPKEAAVQPLVNPQVSAAAINVLHLLHYRSCAVMHYITYPCRTMSSIPQVECETRVFQTVGDYTAFVRAQVGKGTGQGGIYGTAFADVLQLFRKNVENADPALTVTHGVYAILYTSVCVCSVCAVCVLTMY
jgi:hypothetical protein